MEEKYYFEDDRKVIPDKRNGISKEEAMNAVQVLLEWAGDDPEREGLKETPHRVIKSYLEFFKGYDVDPIAILKKTFSEVDGYQDMVVLKDIRLESYCEHHMVPFIGTCHIAYMPDKRVVGISKLARVMEAFAKRLQIQEVLTQQIANTIQDVLKPKGVAVLIEAKHFCIATRGIHKSDVSMVTSSMLGCFENISMQDQFFRRIGK